MNKRGRHVIINASVPVRMHMPPAFTVIGADDVFKVARQLRDGTPGRVLRGIPAIETFQFMKCANQATGDEEGGGRDRD